MPELKLGVQLRSLRQPFKTALKLAAELGASAVEIDVRNELRPQEMSQTGLRQLRKTLDDLRLSVSAVSFWTRRGYNVLDELDRRVAATKEAMQLAYSLGTPVVINQIGRVPHEAKGPEWDILVDVMRDLGEFGQHAGAFLCAETGSEDGADLKRLIDALPEGMLGVNFDPGNLIVNGFSAMDAAHALGPAIRHVHAKDGVRDLAKGRGVEVQVGRGAVDFPALIGLLAEHGYRGYLTIERDNAADPVLEVGQAIRYLKSL